MIEGNSSVAESSRSADSSVSKKHLFIIIHGLLGQPDHVDTIRSSIKGVLQDEIDTFLPEANKGFYTYDGIEIIGQRLLEELRAFVEEKAEKNITYDKLSIVGYSLGGLTARYLIGLLSESDVLSDCKRFSFTTFATPHIGSKLLNNNYNARILNFMGSNFLGKTGADLFGNGSSLLEDMADPSLRYFKGLKQFEHLFLFANMINDRTVPFPCAYITLKNPFNEPDHLDITYYPLEAGIDRDGRLLSQDIIDSTKPIFVDMAKSRYLQTPEKGKNKDVAADPMLRTAMYILLPLILPVVTSVSTTMSLISYYRVRQLRSTLAISHKTTKMVQDDPNTNQDDSHRNSEHHVRDMAEFTGDMMDEFLTVEQPDRDPDEGNGHVEPRNSLKRFNPQPARGSGSDGLLDSCPHSLPAPASVVTIANNLNTLPWEKYTVRLQRSHSHAEIVNRRHRPGQGDQIVGFWAELIAYKLENSS